MKKTILIFVIVVLVLMCVVSCGVSREEPAETAPAQRPETTEATIMIEGSPVDVRYQEVTGESTDAVPGFSIYVDEAVYEVTEENGVTYIRAIGVLSTEQAIREGNSALLEGLTPEEQDKEVKRLLDKELAFYYSMPHCEMEIVHFEEISTADAAEALRSQMLSSWETVYEIEYSEVPAGLCFFASNGDAWNSEQEDIYFISDGRNGCFRVTIRYFLEAAEGHGVRFREMLETFEVNVP